MKDKLIVLLLGLALSTFVGCGDDDDDNPAGSGGVSDFEVVQMSVDAYTGGDKAPTITAEALYENLNDGDASNDPYVLSVRAASAYEAGHIPTAANIPWKEIGDAAKLATLPMDRQIVVYCYTGHTGGVATTALNAMGYDAVNMKWGMVGWTKEADVRATSAFSEDTSPDYPVETTANAAGSYELADPDFTDSDVEAEIVRAAVNAAVAKSPTITAEALYENLNDGDTSNDPVVVSVRSATHYAIGHIPGAINIPWREIAKVESLKKLPTDRQIVVYCYTGHTGAVATTALNMLGYTATNMKWGMVGWTKDADVRATSAFSEDSTPDYPVEQ